MKASWRPKSCTIPPLIVPPLWQWIHRPEMWASSLILWKPRALLWECQLLIAIIRMLIWKPGERWDHPHKRVRKVRAQVSCHLLLLIMIFRARFRFIKGFRGDPRLLMQMQWMSMVTHRRMTPYLAGSVILTKRLAISSIFLSNYSSCCWAPLVAPLRVPSRWSSLCVWSLSGRSIFTIARLNPTFQCFLSLEAHFRSLNTFWAW